MYEILVQQDTLYIVAQFSFRFFSYYLFSLEKKVKK